MDMSASADLGLLILRVYLGINFLAYGAQKLFGLFGGPGLKGWTGYVASLRMRPARWVALFGAVSETGAAILLLLGLLVPLASAAIIASMVVATFTVHIKNGYFNSKGGFTYPLSIIAIAAALAFTGPGSTAIGTSSWQLAWLGSMSGPVGVALGVLGAVLVLSTRSRVTDATLTGSKA